MQRENQINVDLHEEIHANMHVCSSTWCNMNSCEVWRRNHTNVTIRNEGDTAREALERLIESGRVTRDSNGRLSAVDQTHNPNPDNPINHDPATCAPCVIENQIERERISGVDVIRTSGRQSGARTRQRDMQFAEWCLDPARTVMARLMPADTMLERMRAEFDRETAEREEEQVLTEASLLESQDILRREGHIRSHESLQLDPALDSYIGYNPNSEVRGSFSYSGLIPSGDAVIIDEMSSGHSSYGGCKKCWYYSMLFGGSSDGGVGTRKINSEEDFEVAKQEYVEHFNDDHKDIMLKRDKPDNAKVFKEVEKDKSNIMDMYSVTWDINRRVVEQIDRDARETMARYTAHVRQQEPRTATGNMNGRMRD